MAILYQISQSSTTLYSLNKQLSIWPRSRSPEAPGGLGLHFAAACPAPGSRRPRSGRRLSPFFHLLGCAVVVEMGVVQLVRSDAIVPDALSDWKTVFDVVPGIFVCLGVDDEVA
jgi:hypothetical protein